MVLAFWFVIVMNNIAGELDYIGQCLPDFPNYININVSGDLDTY